MSVLLLGVEFVQGRHDEIDANQRMCSDAFRCSRSNILEASRRTDNPKSTANVNLFLNALGLGIDASQLAGMPA